ncbi:glutamyl-tRNA reductase [Halonotius roseus]|uniref:Glutamyl-tRNA reductase n=1 Tax=Halonotius roseus TaxID=2511997 RepID=A0A544QM19_9EURY|nr:glutamyl-tRNA reductase [Halonotius roseus]TQQ79647.1 glutamyl-tRNA reductase [Halonotius roseus]
MTPNGVITGVRVAHDTATVDEIEAASADDVPARIADLLATPGVREAFAVQTCNRAEAYVVTDRAEQGRAALAEIAEPVRSGAVVTMAHEESLRHLMRLAAGLESLVLGEDQIIGQLKDAVETARRAEGLGPMLEDALMKAVHVGERARTETAINEGVVSLGSAAVTLAERETDLDGATALVIGAGEMGTIAAESIADTPIDRLLIANRTIPHATHIADTVSVDASAIGLSAAGAAADRADVVIAATGSPDHVLAADELSRAGETLCIDLAQPRDIEPAADAEPGVTIHDIDALEAITAETHARREDAAAEVEAMIDEEFDRLLALFKRKRADEAISTMYESAERVKDREVGTAMAKLDANAELTDTHREVIESLADSLVSQLLAAPTKSLREAAAEDDWTTIQTAMQLFNPEFDGPIPTDEIDDPVDDESADADTDVDSAAGESDDTPAGPPESPAGLPDGVDPEEIPPHVLEQLSDN